MEIQIFQAKTLIFPSSCYKKKFQKNSKVFSLECLRHKHWNAAFSIKIYLPLINAFAQCLESHTISLQN